VLAAYVEQLGRSRSAPSVKQHLAALRMLFDWLVVGQALSSNPALVVRGPKHVVRRGKTPVLSPEEARALFEAIPADTLVGLRDRALLGVLIYGFARISAALAMRVEDYAKSRCRVSPASGCRGLSRYGAYSVLVAAPPQSARRSPTTGS
jgi:integrase/recombinase XerD